MNKLLILMIVLLTTVGCAMTPAQRRLDREIGAILLCSSNVNAQWNDRTKRCEDLPRTECVKTHNGYSCTHY